MQEITGMFKRWWVALIFGIAAIAFSIFMFMYPAETYVTLSYAFAFYFIIYGIYKSVYTVMEREEIPAWGWSFALGLLTAVLGVMLLLPGMATGTFVFYITFCVMFMGINACSASFALKAAGDKGWGWTLALGILTIIMSIIMLNYPLMSAGVISLWAGMMFMFLGISLCGLAYRLSVAHSVSKKLHHAV